MSSPGTLAFALTGSLLAFASTASAQTPDTFQRMNAGYAAAMGRPAGGPTAPFLRVSAEVLGGALAGAAGGGVGLLVGGLACGFDALSAVGASTSSCTGRLPVGIFAPATAPTATSRGRVAPVAAITPAGAHFGLAGTF
jgi:hypothetical protein